MTDGITWDNPHIKQRIRENDVHKRIVCDSCGGIRKKVPFYVIVRKSMVARVGHRRNDYCLSCDGWYRWKMFTRGSHALLYYKKMKPKYQEHYKKLFLFSSTCAYECLCQSSR